MEEKDGDTWILDAATGTLFLDPHDPATGLLAVTPDGAIWNFWNDTATNKVAEKYLGTISDLVSVDSENLGVVTAFAGKPGVLPPTIPLSVDPRTGEQGTCLG